MDQNRESRTGPYIYGYLFYDKVATAVQWGKDGHFNKWCWANWLFIQKKYETDCCLIVYTPIKISSWFWDICFLKRTNGPNHKENIDKLDDIQLRSSSHQKSHESEERRVWKMWKEDLSPQRWSVPYTYQDPHSVVFLWTTHFKLVASRRWLIPFYHPMTATEVVVEEGSGRKCKGVDGEKGGGHPRLRSKKPQSITHYEK